MRGLLGSPRFAVFFLGLTRAKRHCQSTTRFRKMMLSRNSKPKWLTVLVLITDN